MAEAKACSKCGRKLRADNTKGVCSIAAACAERAAERSDAGDDPVLDRVGMKPPPRKSEAVKRFRTVADALGYDPDELLAEYCEGWLANLKQKAFEG